MRTLVVNTVQLWGTLIKINKINRSTFISQRMPDFPDEDVAVSIHASEHF